MPDLGFETKALLKKLEAFPRKRMGQNFMVNDSVLSFIKGALCLKEGDRVLEIGPGLGFLTRHLLENGNEVLAVEKDILFTKHLEDTFKGRPLGIFQNDILKLNLKRDLNVEEPLKIAGNIPYNITSPILEWLILQKPLVSEAVLTVQREVAERLTARPGNKTWGSLSVFVQFHAKVDFMKVIPKTSFYPVPKVDSAVVRLEFPLKPIYPVRNEAFFSALVRRAFQKRRKTILNALLNPKEEKFKKSYLIKTLEQTCIDPIRRPETLSIPEWVALSESL